LSFFQQRRQGDTLALLTRDVYVVSGYISGTALAIVPLLFTVAGAVFFMFRLEPVLALLAAFLIPLFFLLLKIFGRRIRPLATQLSEEHATAIAIAEENLGISKGGDGLQSLAWWREGRIAEIEEYCRLDVALLRDLFDRALAQGHLVFRTRDGERVRIPTPWQLADLLERARVRAEAPLSAGRGRGAAGAARAARSRAPRARGGAPAAAPR